MTTFYICNEDQLLTDICLGLLHLSWLFTLQGAYYWFEK